MASSKSDGLSPRSFRTSSALPSRADRSNGHDSRSGGIASNCDKEPTTEPVSSGDLHSSAFMNGFSDGEISSIQSSFPVNNDFVEQFWDTYLLNGASVKSPALAPPEADPISQASLERRFSPYGANDALGSNVVPPLLGHVGAMGSLENEASSQRSSKQTQTLTQIMCPVCLETRCYAGSIHVHLDGGCTDVPLVTYSCPHPGCKHTFRYKKWSDERGVIGDGARHWAQCHARSATFAQDHTTALLSSKYIPDVWACSICRQSFHGAHQRSIFFEHLAGHESQRREVENEDGNGAAVYITTEDWLNKHTDAAFSRQLNAIIENRADLVVHWIALVRWKYGVITRPYWIASPQVRELQRLIQARMELRLVPEILNSLLNLAVGISIGTSGGILAMQAAAKSVLPQESCADNQYSFNNATYPATTSAHNTVQRYIPSAPFTTGSLDPSALHQPNIDIPSHRPTNRNANHNHSHYTSPWPASYPASQGVPVDHGKAPYYLPSPNESMIPPATTYGEYWHAVPTQAEPGLGHFRKISPITPNSSFSPQDPFTRATQQRPAAHTRKQTLKRSFSETQVTGSAIDPQSKRQKREQDRRTKANRSRGSQTDRSTPVTTAV